MARLIDKIGRFRLGLLGQFVIGSLVVVVAIALGLAWLIGNVIEGQALAELEGEAQDTLAARVERQLTPEDFEQPMTGERYDEFYRFVGESVRSDRTDSIKVWNREGLVIFAVNPAEVGELIPNNAGVQVAIAGETNSHLSEGEEMGQLLEVYTPLVLSGSPEIVGALEIYQDSGAITGHIEEARLSILAGLGGGLALLWIALVGIVANGSRTIARQRDSLVTTRALADTDGLTGLCNHRAFHERIGEEVSRARESGRPVALVMLDVDNFKRINDSQGHQAGDNTLRQLAGILAGVAGEGTAFRYGGDEFVMLLPGTNRAMALGLAERLRRAVGERLEDEQITISLGVASLPDGAATVEELVYGADVAMYLAKSEGKNRVGDWARLTQGRIDGVLPWYAADPAVHDPEVVAALGAALAAKDPSTMAHTERCSRHAANLARELGLGKKETSIVRLASLLHDIGKLAVPDQILFKPGPLNEEEWESMKQHPTAALRILGQIRSLTDVTPSIVHHHEHFDGSGYPDGLAGQDIPIASRILLVTDAFDAMTNDRSYRKAMSIKAAVEELTHNKGGQFDPKVVDAFLRVLVRDGVHPPRPDSSVAAEEMILR